MTALETKILDLLSSRSAHATICPSEVLAAKDRKNKVLMEQVRNAARRLVAKNIIEITQKGKAVDPNNFKGPIRLKLK